MVEMKMTIKDTLTKPLIKDVFKGELGAVSFAVVEYLCTRFIESFAFSTKLGPEQIQMLTVDTLEAFGYESLEDIILFLKMARSGKFGNTKRSVDSNLVYGEWFPMYMDLKARKREEIQQEKKSKEKEDLVSMEVIKKRYAKNENDRLMADRRNKAKLFVDKVSKDFDKQMLEDTIREWSKDKNKDYYTALLKKKRLIIK